MLALPVSEAIAVAGLILAIVATAATIIALPASRLRTGLVVTFAGATIAGVALVIFSPGAPSDGTAKSADHLTASTGIAGESGPQSVPAPTDRRTETAIESTYTALVRAPKNKDTHQLPHVAVPGNGAATTTDMPTVRRADTLTTRWQTVAIGDFRVEVSDCRLGESELICNLDVQNDGDRAALGMWSTGMDPDKWSYVRIGKTVHGPAMFHLFSDVPVIHEPSAGALKFGLSHGGIVEFQSTQRAHYTIRFVHIPEDATRIDELSIVSGLYQARADGGKALGGELPTFRGLAIARYAN